MRIKPPTLVSRSDFSVASVDELIFQLRAEPEDYPAGSMQRNMLESLIAVASDWFEAYTGRTMVGAVYLLCGDGFPASDIELPVYPLRDVVSIVYVDGAGADQTIDVESVDVDYAALRPRMRMAGGWPVAATTFNSVKITVGAGYESAAKIPAKGKAAVLMLAAHLHENASATAAVKLEQVPFGVKALADTLRVSWL